MSNDSINLVQPGMIVAYAGDVSTPGQVKALAALGWLVCDGTSYPKSQYPSLALAIGQNYGGTGGSRGAFNVPDLRGRFLRGTSYSSGTDPDAVSRLAMNPGGSTGNEVGSLQSSATALPANAFVFFHAGDHSHTVGNVPQQGNAYALVGGHYAIRNTGGVSTDNQGLHSHVLGNWDNESRPVNLYVNYLINSGSATGNGNATTPLYGMIAAFAFSLQGTPPPAAPWLFCNGGVENRTALPLLFKALGATWGSGDGSKTFNIPNFQGAFIRGVDPSVNPLATSQSDATALPQNAQFQATTAGDHFHNVSHVPPSDTSYYSITGDHYGWDQQTQTTSTEGSHQHSCGVTTGSGGDLETRPANAYVDFGILGDVTGGSVTDTFAVGTIMPYGSPLNQATLSAANWLNCDGSTLSRTQYAALFAAIGTSFGKGDGVSTFNLPNLVGVFPRGVNGSGSGLARDPDAALRVSPPGVSGGNTGNAVGSYQSAATGAPVTPMNTSQDGTHSHNVPNVPNDNSSSAIAGGGQSIWNSGSTQTSTNGAHSHAIASGGDKETRPTNVSCYYVIKYQ